MKLTRRNFILSLAGGLVGINFTPLPWKLMDDIAIWTQNWPWVPVPERGRFHYENTVCTLCPGGCGIKVRKVDGVRSDRCVKIEPREDYPINPEGICPIGMGGLQLLYDESIRFTGPMKRGGLRGAAEFINISWEKAISILASKIKELREKGKPESIVIIDGSRKGSTTSLLIERLARCIGTPNYVRIQNMEDTFEIASFLMTGKKAPLSFDLENSDYILSFGCALIDGWGAPGRVIGAWSRWHDVTNKKRPKIVQIDSRASDTASKATEWIAIKPGTEAALALGIAHVIVKEGRYDKDFVEKRCFGFKDWVGSDGQIHTGFKNLLLKRYSPDKVSDITGVPKEKIISIAKEFSKAKNPVAIFGKDKGELPGSVYEYMAIISLNAISGSINRTGGLIIQDPLPLEDLPEPALDTVARDGLKKERLDGAGTGNAPFTHSIPELISEKADKIELLMVFSSNPAYTLPDGGAFKKALKKIPFIVTFSPFLDDTSIMADLVLPDHTYLEKIDEVIWPPGLQYPFYGLSRPVVKPIYNTRHIGDTIIQLAKSIGGSVAKSFPWDNYEEVVKYRVKGLYKAGGSVNYQKEPVWEMIRKGKRPEKGYKSFSDMWDKIKENGFWFDVPSYKNSFNTPSGRLEFFSQILYKHKRDLKQMGISAKDDEAFMPHYEEKQISASGYELRMVPYGMINLSSSWIPSPAFVYKTVFDNQLIKHDSFIDINPKLAKRLGLKQADKVLISSPVGTLKVRVNITHTVPPGYVYMPMGFGHVGYDEFIKEKGANPNDIIFGASDPISGHKIWWSTPVKIVKV